MSITFSQNDKISVVLKTSKTAVSMGCSYTHATVNGKYQEWHTDSLDIVKRSLDTLFVRCQQNKDVSRVERVSSNRFKAYMVNGDVQEWGIVKRFASVPSENKSLEIWLD